MSDWADAYDSTFTLDQVAPSVSWVSGYDVPSADMRPAIVIPSTPSTVAPAASSWSGFNQIPAAFQSIVDVARAGASLSLAKDQVQANRDIARYGLAAQVARAQTDAQIAAAQSASQVRAAQVAAAYPFGLPFGKTRGDQIMIAIGVAGLLFAAVQVYQGRRKK